MRIAAAWPPICFGRKTAQSLRILVSLVICIAVLCFFFGAVPFGYLLGRLKGVDLRKHGSGNTGATNTARVLGKGIGTATLFLDIAKGALAVFLGSLFDSPNQPIWASVFGVLALFGHCFSPFLKFRGGKGVATGLGVFLVLAPLAASLAVAIFMIAIRISRYVSLSSILAAATLPIVLFFDPKGVPQVLLLASTLSSSLVILRHRTNIQRLLAGTENRWGKPKAA